MALAADKRLERRDSALHAFSKRGFGTAPL